jgi:hypothetical protein
MSADAPSWWHAPACSPVDTPPAPLLLLLLMMMMMMLVATGDQTCRELSSEHWERWPAARASREPPRALHLARTHGAL